MFGWTAENFFMCLSTKRYRHYRWIPALSPSSLHAAVSERLSTSPRSESHVPRFHSRLSVSQWAPGHFGQRLPGFNLRIPAAAQPAHPLNPSRLVARHHLLRPHDWNADGKGMRALGTWYGKLKASCFPNPRPSLTQHRRHHHHQTRREWTKMAGSNALMPAPTWTPTPKRRQEKIIVITYLRQPASAQVPEPQTRLHPVMPYAETVCLASPMQRWDTASPRHRG